MMAVTARVAAIWGSIAALALPASAILTGPLLARALGPEGRGDLAAALAGPQLAVGVASFGMPAAVLYFSARGWSIRALLTWALPTSVVCGAGAICALAGLEPSLVDGGPGQEIVFWVATLTVPLGMLAEVFRNLSIGTGRYSLPLSERWIAVIGRLGILVGLFCVGQLSLVSAGLVTWLSAVAGALIYFRLCFPASPDVRYSPTRYNQQFSFLEFGRYALGSWSSTAVNVLALRLDQLLLAVIVSRTELGYYAVAVAISEIPIVAIGAVKDILSAETVHRQEKSLTYRAIRYAICITVPIAGILACMSPVLVPVLFGFDFVGAVIPTVVLLAASVVAAIGVAAGTGMQSDGRPALLAVAQFVGLLVGVGTLIILAPSNGAVGAAIASLLGYTVATGIVLSIVRHRRSVTWAELILVRKADIKFVLGLLRRKVAK